VQYRFNAPRFAAETFDTEVIVLDLEGGVYYSVAGLAVWLFHELSAGLPRDVAIALAPDEHRDAARAIVDRLVGDAMLVEAAREAVQPSQPPTPNAPPTMTRYDDLQMLLQIDPVHDVDATGWPNPVGR
jgi:hypothetical protein